MKRDNHYEAAFEAYLQHRQVAYVAVDEQRRSQVVGGSLKNADFLVTPSAGATLLVDVKGRRFPSGQTSRQYWKNWSTWDDLHSLASWQQRIGTGAVAMFAFAYHLTEERSPVPRQQLFQFRDRWYAFLAVRVADYIQRMKPLSEKWQTVSMPVADFRAAAVPFDDWLGRNATVPRRDAEN
ncbi:HYExAFE family protein [Adhaeretor mobilis]|uniref:Uncharacterized protein n=1 Tax=Adhaeretor mobilis TaxID=1930276 RepID=A0A517N2D6_9BACT|nr:HYExAFE family protein [Adhaeretor mobilis]QDT01292.1 hypothetical protein HG15A2_46340 [Adhaeretor mobilis]